MNPHVIILGGGISGLTAGYALASQGITSTLLEKSPTIGGLAGTIREESRCLDYGPHSFFTHDAEVKNFVLNLFTPPLPQETRQSAFYFEGKYLDYPLTAASVLFQMGPVSGLKAAWSFILNKFFSEEQKNSPPKDLSVESWALSQFGPYLYQSFFKPYTEQFWRISSKELSAFSIPSHTRTGFMKTLKSLVRGKSSKDNGSQIDRESLPTYYPPTGYGNIAEKVSAKFIHHSGTLITAATIQSVEILGSGGYAVVYQDAEGLHEIAATHLISTIPIPVLIDLIHPAPPEEILTIAHQLDYRPIVNLGMVVERQNILPTSYFYTLDRPYNRLTEMNKFSPATSPANENIIAAEIPCLRNEPLWNASKEALFEYCISTLEKDNILKRSEVKKLILAKAAYAYPIYKLGFQEHLNHVCAYINQHSNFHLLGRTGEFRYMDLDQCIRRALDLAHAITAAAQQNRITESVL